MAKTDADESLDRSEAEAESTAAQSRKEAAERLRRSHEEVAALQEEAEARMRGLDADTEVIRRERRALLDEIRGGPRRGCRMQPGGEEARFPAREPAESALKEMSESTPES
jgi:hypothetical protein